MARRPLYGSTATAGAPVDPFTISRSNDAPGGNAQAPFPQLDRGPQSVHSSDLFFDNNPNMYGQANQASQSSSGGFHPASQLYPYHQQAFHQPLTSPPRPQTAQNPYIYNPQQGYGGTQQPNWPPVPSPPIISQPNPDRRPQRHQTAAAAPSLLQSFSVRPTSTYVPPQGPPASLISGRHAHHPPYRTQSLFGQAAPPSLPPPLPTRAPTHSNPYISPPPTVFNQAVPVAFNNTAEAPYQHQPLSANPYITPNVSPPISYAAPKQASPPTPSQSIAPNTDDDDVPSSPDSDPEELARAIAMSETESNQRRLIEEKLQNQEEEELARALAESLKASESNSRASVSYSANFASSSKQPLPTASQPQPQRPSVQVDTKSYGPPDQDGLATPIAHAPAASTDSYDDDFDFGLGNHRGWQDGAGSSSQGASGSTAGISSSSRPTASKTRSRPSSVSSGSSLPYTLPSPELERAERKNSLPKYVPASARLSSSLAAMESLQHTETEESRLVFDDEAYARQLAQEEEQGLAQLIERKARMEAERERQYNDALPPEYTSEGVLRPDSHSEDSHTNMAGPSSSSSSSQPSPPPKTALSQHSPFVDSPHESRPHAKSMSSFASSSSSSTASYSDVQSIQSTQSASFQPQRPHSNSYSAAVPSNVPQSSSSGSAGLLNPNHFVDRELLMGVSIGFKPPAILPKPTLMEDTMPNIISLPATRCPPLHLQAPDWQHLLRLMARLSNTRIEPTVEAMAATKAEVKLRTVIQFIKPRNTANVWRTVLWFSIDQYIPTEASARYLSGNPNLLPYSYTQQPVPILLRDASDTNLSKTFTIPASDAVPLPTLPITFPNLALYLHAALQESRRHSRSSDAASGLGKLGKMVQMCYPNARELDQDDESPGRSSAINGLFKRVIGRGNKDKRKGKTTNEETYQLVTPFVPDEWG